MQYIRLPGNLLPWLKTAMFLALHHGEVKKNKTTELKPPFSSCYMDSTWPLCLCLVQMSLRWTQRGFLGTNSPVSHAAVNTYSVPSGSPRTSRPPLTTFFLRSFTSCSRLTLRDFSPTSSTSPDSVIPAGWWPERTDTTSPTWSVFLVVVLMQFSTKSWALMTCGKLGKKKFGEMRDKFISIAHTYFLVETSFIVNFLTHFFSFSAALWPSLKS